MSKAATKACPFCAETIKAAALLCRFCGRDLTAPTPLAVPVVTAAPPAARPDAVLLRESEVLDLLTALVQKSLAVYEEDAQGGGRYRLLETVRQYARDRLLETGEPERVRARHRDWSLALAEEAMAGWWGSEEAVWLERLEREQDNLRAALEWSGQPGQVEAGLRLGVALGQFWWARGHLEEGRAHLEGLVALPGTEARTAQRAHALQSAGALARDQGDYRAARALWEAGLSIHRELGDKLSTGWSLRGLGSVARAQGDDGAARAFYEESVSIFRELGDKRCLAYSLCGLGDVAGDQGHEEAAQAFLEEGLALSRETSNKLPLAHSLARLASFAHHRGEYGTARALLEESITVCREVGYKLGVVNCLEGLAAVALAEPPEKPERAARLLGAAASLREAMGAPLPPADRAGHDRSRAAVRAVLGEAAFAAACAEGRAMSLEEAVSFALGEGADG